MFLTWPVSKDPTLSLVNALHSENMDDISIALLVLKVLRSKLVNALHPANICPKLVTLLVTRPVKSIDFKALQLRNMPYMVLTAAVFQLSVLTLILPNP